MSSLSTSNQAFTLPKLLLVSLVALATAGFCWVAFRAEGAFASSVTRWTLCSMACIYLARLCLTNFLFLKRAVPWGEALVVSVWVVVILAVYAACARLGSVFPVWVLWPAALLYVVGSFLNTASEAQRRSFKANPANRGRLFTGGLFGVSMHINYFGDSVLFMGFALATLHYGSLVIPLLMTVSFLFGHIRRMDAYLAEKYGEQFTEYAARTKKFVPYVY